MAKILYLGDDSFASTSSQRAYALKRLGHEVEIFNPASACIKQLKSKIFFPLHVRTGYRLLQSAILKWLTGILRSVSQPDIIWINSGELLGTECLKLLKKINCPIVLYNNDDATGKRDGRRFDQLIKSLHYYDLCAVMREINVDEYKLKGAKRVIRVFMSYDEVAHQPFANIEEIPLEYRSDVAFIGTWMRNENRDRFLLDLISQGILVKIWGNRWEKSPFWESLKPYFFGHSLQGRNYVAAMQGAKICLGLLSKGNRDMHTQRSLEVPYAGGLLCAERTKEHLEMYMEYEEAVFWSDSLECANVCKTLLNNDVKREKIRVAGMKKIRELKVGNEDVCTRIIKELYSVYPSVN